MFRISPATKLDEAVIVGDGGYFNRVIRGRWQSDECDPDGALLDCPAELYRVTGGGDSPRVVTVSIDKGDGKATAYLRVSRLSADVQALIPS